MSSGRIQLELVGTGSIQTALGDRRKFRTVIFPTGPRGRDGSVSGSIAWTNVTGKPTEFPPESHTHTKSEVGLENVDNTADASKPVSTLQAAADTAVATAAAAALTAHVGAADPHTVYQLKSEKGAVDGYASLGSDGKVPSSQLPTASAGKVLNVWYAKTTTAGSTTNTIPLDNTIPQNTEGAEIFSVSVTPSSASSKLIVTFSFWGSNSNTATPAAALFLDSDADAVASTLTQSAMVANIALQILGTFVIDSWSGTKTVKLRAGLTTSGFTFRWLQTVASEFFGGTDQGVMTIMEVEV
jgi:hypothetical protein